MRKILFILFCFMLWVSALYAACPGDDCTSCGDRCYTVTSNSQAAVQATVNACTSEDEWWTVNVPEGEVTWTSGITVANKKIKLLGGYGGTYTTINASMSSAGYSVAVIRFNVTTYPIEISGFNFSGVVGNGNPLIIDKTQSGNSTKVNGIRVHRNVFNTINKSMWIGYAYGLVDNNVFLHPYSYIGVREVHPSDTGGTYDTLQGAASWNRGIDFSTFGADAVYFENNTLSHSGQLNFFYDASYGARVVARFNTITNSVLSFHGIGQGQAGNRGSFLNVWYNNKILYNQAGWSIASLKVVGGTGLAFNNTSDLSGAGTGTFYSQIYSYRSNPAYSVTNAYALGFQYPCSAENMYADGGPDGPTDGYPCGDNIGTSGALGLSGQTITPFYAWNNKQKGVAVKFAPLATDVYTAVHTQNNRDYYDQDDANCPTRVDGSTACTAGVGVGTQRPDLCTAGVAYYETDEQALYKCTATNTWTKYFEPYTCPHPLAGEGTCDYNVAGTAGYSLGLAPDETPPVISATTPTGQQACTGDDEEVEIGVTTDEAATCKYDTSDVAYASMANTFSSTGGTTHTQTVTSDCSSSPLYYVRCMDAAENVNTVSAQITYQMASDEDTTPPTMGSAALGVGGRTLTLTASEAVQIGAGGNEGLALSSDGGAVTASFVSIVGTTVTFYTSRIILGTETLTWTYTQPGNGIEDLAGNDMATVGDAQAITNNSTQEAEAGSGGAMFADYGVTGAVSTGNPVELGMKVTTTAAIKVTEVCFYKDVTNTGTHIVNVWSASGVNLARQTVVDETESGWQCQALDTPAEILPDATFIVSYFSPTGVWNSVIGYFATSLVVGAYTSDSGLYAYGASTRFPNTASQRNYLVDFKATAGYEVTPSLTGTGGTISGSRVGLADEQPTVAVTLRSGHRVKSVGGTCGGSGSLSGYTYTYTPTALSADCTVEAEVEAIPLLN